MSEASDLIATLKDLALSSFNQAANRGDALNAAAYQVYPFRQHYGIESQDYQKIIAPALSIPPVPVFDNMVVDFDAALTQVKSLVDGLETSWLMKYFPATLPEGIEPLLNQVLNGTLVPEIIQEIMWERTKEQTQRDALRAENDAISNWASRGFSLPGGVVTQQVQQVSQQLLDQNSVLAAMQAIKALEIQVEATKLAAEIATRLRLGLIEALINLIAAYSRLPSAAAEYASAVAGAQRNAYTAIAEYYRAVIASADITLKADIVNADNAIKHLGLVADYQGRFGANQVAARVAGVDTFAKTAAAALAGLNGTATVVEQTIN